MWRPLLRRAGLDTDGLSHIQPDSLFLITFSKTLARTLCARASNRVGTPQAIDEEVSTLSIRLLLADDDCDFLDVTAYALRRAGFVVSTASNGDEALAHWRSEAPDIVLLDVAMPGIPGTQVCRTIRNTSMTPVILVSGGRRETDIIEGFRVGADDYLTKPFSVQQLVLRVQAVHRRTGGQISDILPRTLHVDPISID